MPWIILDRDGVINYDSDQFIKSLDEWKPIPCSIEAIAQLSRHGYQIAVLSNQSGIGRGLLSLATLTAMHEHMQKLVVEAGGRIDYLDFCPHDPMQNCNCRKPKTGLFERLAKGTGAELRGAPAIGDSYRDLQAAAAMGCQPILVKTGKGRQTLEQYPDLPYPVFENLHDAAQHLLG